MWASNGSLHPTQLDILCLKSNPSMSKIYRTPDSHSNRAFALKFSLDNNKKFIKNNNMGNMMASINIFNKKSNYGTINKGIGIIKQFLILMRPYIKVENMRFKFDSKDPHLNIDLEINGCLAIDNFKINEPKTMKTPEFSAYQIYGQAYLSQVMNFKIPFDAQDPYWALVEEDSNLNFNIDCDSSLIDSVPPEKRSKVSIYTQFKDPKAKLITHKNQRLGKINLRKAEIVNINFQDHKDKILFYAKRYNRIICVPTRSLTVYLGQFAMANISFDADLSEILLTLNEDQYPTPEMLQNNENISLDYGFINTMLDETKNQNVIQRALDVKNEWRYVNIGLGEVKNWKEMRWGIYASKSPIYKIILENRKKMYDSKICKDREFNKDEVAADKIDHNDLFDKGIYNSSTSLKLFAGESKKFSVNSFLDLVGKRAGFHFILDDESKRYVPENINKKDILTSLAVAIRKMGNFYLEGTIGLNDPEIHGKKVDNKFEFPTDQEFKSMEGVKGLYLENRSLTCSSLNTDIVKLNSIQIEKLPPNPPKNHPSFLENKTYYAISLYPIQGTKPPRGKLELRVGDHGNGPEDFFVIHNKKDSYKLKKADGEFYIKLENDINPTRYSKFEYEDLLENFFVLGKLVKVFKPDGETMVFDCFLEIYNGYNGFETTFDLHTKVLRKVLDFKHLVAPEALDKFNDVHQRLANKLLAQKESDFVMKIWGYLWLGLLYVFMLRD